MNNQTDSQMIRRMFIRLLPVQILMVAIGSLNSIVDGAMAGQLLGAYALAVTGLFAPLIKVTETVNAILMSGSSIICGKLLGKNQVEQTRSVFSLDMLLTLLFAGGLTLVCLLFPDGIAGALGAKGEMAVHLRDYMLGYLPGFLPAMISTQLSVFLQLEQQEKRIYAGIGVMLVSNLLMNYLLVAKGGMGVFGLGLATTISTWAFLLVQLTFYLGGKAIIRMDLHHLRIADIKEIFYIGLPGAVGVLCLTIRFLLLNHIILQYGGEVSMAAFSAVNAFGGLFYATTAGVAAATRLLVSVYLGEEDRTGLLLIMRTALKNGIALVAAAAVLFIVLSGVITGIFYSDPLSEVYLLTRWGFALFPISMPMSAFCVIFIGYYQCRKQMGIVHILSVMDGVAGTVLTALLLMPVMGGMGIWITQLLNGVYTTVIVLVYAVIRGRKFPCSTAELITLPEDFGVSPDDRMDLTIRSLPEVVNTSEAVVAFCLEHGVENKRAVYAGLCMEEMAGNIVEHGFTDGRRHSVDIRIVYRPEELLLRFKDDCRVFNPKEREELFDPEDITHNIGIRMVSRIAKSMTYQNILGLNVLTILV